MTTGTESYDSPLKSILYAIAGVFVFSLHDVIVKWISGEYPVHEIILIRSCFSIIPILFIARLEGGLHLLRTSHFGAHFIRSFIFFGAYICFYLSLAALALAETIEWGPNLRASGWVVNAGDLDLTLGSHRSSFPGLWRHSAPLQP